MPNEYPDFLTPKLMMEYLRIFAEKFDLVKRIEFGVELTAIQKYGRLDILVNNAGIGGGRTVDKTSTAEFDRVMNTNLRGMFSRVSLLHWDE